MSWIIVRSTSGVAMYYTGISWTTNERSAKVYTYEEAKKISDSTGGFPVRFVKKG